MEILFKNRNFVQKSKFLVKNQTVGPKIELFVKNRNFRQKSKFEVLTMLI